MLKARNVGITVFVLVWSMSTHGKPSVSGDEPYYLLVTESLIADGDLDVANNLAANGGALFGAEHLEGGDHVRINRHGASWSVHDVGISFVAAPAYAVGRTLEARAPQSWLTRFRLTSGRLTYFIVSLFFVGLTSVAAMLLFDALTALGSRHAAFFVTLAVTLSPPTLVHAFLVFPETPAFFVTCLVLWLALQRGGLGFRLALTGALVLGATPWLHRKYALYAFAVAWLCAFWQRESVRGFSTPQRAALAAAFVVPHAALHLMTLWAWGGIGGPLAVSGAFSPANVPIGLAGLFFDRSRGLLPYAPIYVLAPLAWWLSGRRFVAAWVPIASLLLLVAAYVTWNAGYSPAARFLVPLTPLFALPAVKAIEVRWFRLVAAPVVVLQLAISAYGWQRPRALWPGEVGDNRALTALPVIGRTLNAMFPVIDNGSWRPAEPAK